MTTAQATDGQDSGQGARAPEVGDAGGDTAGTGGASRDRTADLEARVEELNDTISELRSAILASRNGGGAAAAPVEDEDDSQPLTPSKVKKIVRDSVANVAAANQSLSQRQLWDDKAKSEFPLSDPKFRLEFKRQWREQVDAGLDPNHPRAVYNVAKITARTTGFVKKELKGDAETTQTSEAPTNSAARTSRQSARTPTVSDDDPRLAFYKMKGDRKPEQIEAMKKKLAERDQARRSR